jgi:DNA adenine methylase
MNKPFLKWAGNKFRVLPHLIPHIGDPKRYIEPFGGSLSVALNISADEYILNDINKDLYCLYTNVDKEFVGECRELFTDENNTRERYLELRKEFNSEEDCRKRAKLFLYLNKHAFNGLSRYNSKGEYNVPYGKENKDSKTGRIVKTKAHFPEQELNYFRDVFSNRKVEFCNTSFSDEALYKNVSGGDVQQVELAELAESLCNRGAKVIVSNHDTPVSRELYKNAQIHSIQVARFISAKGSSRKKANELIAVYQS